MLTLNCWTEKEAGAMKLLGNPWFVGGLCVLAAGIGSLISSSGRFPAGRRPGGIAGQADARRAGPGKPPRRDGPPPGLRRARTRPRR